jgi:hypothetical protein
MTNGKQQFNQLCNATIETQVFGENESDVIDPIGSFINSFTRTHGELLPKDVMRLVTTNITRVIVNCFDPAQYLGNQNIDHRPLWKSSLAIINQAMSVDAGVTQDDLSTQGLDDDDRRWNFIYLFPDTDGNIGASMEDIFDEVSQVHVGLNQDFIKEYCMNIVRDKARIVAEKAEDLMMDQQQIGQEVAHRNHITVGGQEVIGFVPVPAPSSVNVIPLSPQQRSQG